MLLIVLSGIAPAIKDEPAWVKDYSAARKLCQEEQKPIAAFIGSGAAGWNDLSREGQLNKETARLLAQHYICLYVDRRTDEGQFVAQALEMHDSRGIVISSSSGKLQAFRHEGDLRNQDLAHYLRRFSSPNLVVLHTETNPPEREYVAPTTYYRTISTGRSC
jgi:hypothetical protein